MAVLNMPQKRKQVARPIILTAAMPLRAARTVAATEEPGTMVAARMEVEAAMAVGTGAEAMVVAGTVVAVVAGMAVVAVVGVAAVAAESD
jgi:hypothetical protein